MSIDEIVGKYKKEIEEAKKEDKKKVIEEIIIRMKKLTYEVSKETISNEDLIKILKELERKLLKESHSKFSQSETEFQKVISQTLKSIEEKKK